MSPRGGAAFISLPQDVQAAAVGDVSCSGFIDEQLGPAPAAATAKAAQQLAAAKQPVLLLGLGATKPANTQAIHRLLKKFPLATVETFQAAGALSRELAKYFAGRVGLFRNQPGDRLLESADVVMTVGFDPVEYDPEVWNAESKLHIIHVDDSPLAVGHRYHPRLELQGDIAATLDALCEKLPSKSNVANAALLGKLREQLDAGLADALDYPQSPIHPLRFIHDLQSVIDDKTTVISDVGSHYMWLARHLYCYRPHRLLFSNGQQTLGVALPWAMATTLVRPGEKVISISGDGGFLFSAMELETAVREQRHFVHFVWRDGSYDMVGAQEMMKYGRKSGVEFGRVDLVKFAESFGARGFALQSADEILPALAEAQSLAGPVLIDVPIDYSHNAAMFAATDAHGGH